MVQDLCIVSNGERLQYKCENGIQTAEGFVIFWDTLDPRFLIENAGGLAGEVEISGTICVIA